MKNSCILTNSKNVKKIIDLGLHPFADTFIKKRELKYSEPLYPLELIMCSNSGSIQTKFITKDYDRYNMYDYSYTSSNSKFSRKHWKNYCKEIMNKLSLNKKSQIIEIGSNDGFLLTQFKNKGYKVLGVDSSKYMQKLSLTKKIKTICSIFNYKNSNKILNKFGKSDLVIANNVLNHSNNPKDFVKGAYNLLKDDGIFVFELPYWLTTIKTKKFDQIYHEHITYFTVKFSYNLLKMNNFKVFDIKFIDYHGGSIRVFSKKNNNPTMSKKLKNLIATEEEYGLFKIRIYKNLMKHINFKKKRLIQKLTKIKSKGFCILGVGAAAKSNTFLNTYGIDRKYIDFITDASIHKQGKFMPKTRIPIVSDRIFKNYKKVYAIILSWNISTQLKQKLKKINNNIYFLKI